MGRDKPSGPHADEMTGPRAWPETDEDTYTNRANELNGILSKVDAALGSWQGHQASIFNGPHVWSGDAAKQAGAAVDGATKAMQEHREQLWAAREWCRSAATNIANTKETITTNVEAGQLEIGDIEKTASKTSHSPDAAIRSIVQRKYNENIRTVEALAAALGWKPDISASPAEGPDENDRGQSGEAGSNAGPSFVRH